MKEVRRQKQTYRGRWCLSAERRTPCVTSRHCVGSGDAGRPPMQPLKCQPPLTTCRGHSYVSGEALVSGTIHGKEFKPRGTPRPDPQTPLATKPGWGRGLDPEFRSVNDCLGPPLPPLGPQGAWGWPWSCAWEGTGHIPSIPSLSPLVCLLVLSQRPQELLFPFVSCWWPASRDFLGSWNHKLDKPQDIPHPPNCTPHFPRHHHGPATHG